MKAGSFLGNKDLAARVPALVALVAALAATLAVAVTHFLARDILEDEAFNKIKAVQQARTTELSIHLRAIETEITLLAESDMVVDGLHAFEAAWADMEGDRRTELQKRYIRDNPFPDGKRDSLIAGTTGDAYDQAHARHHPWFRKLREARGYYDVFLIDHDGNVIYTVEKERDFGSNLYGGRVAETGLGETIRAIHREFQPGAVAFTDFEPYAPSNYAPAAFIAAPVFDRHGERHGVLAFQMPIGVMNALMQQRAGMGETGEAYLVGADLLMRSESLATEQADILRTRVDTPQANMALKGETSAIKTVNYRGGEVISAFGPIAFLGATWAVVVEEDADAILAPIHAMGRSLALVAAGVIAAMGLFAVVLARIVFRPVAQLTETFERLAEGDIGADIPHADRDDEIGRMAKAAAAFREMTAKTMERNWVRGRIAELTTRLQQSEGSRAFFDGAASGISEIAGCGWGALHVLEPNSGEFEPLGRYAIGEEAPMVGEGGLVRQCADGRAPIALDALPDGYLNIRSGAGEAPPRTLTLHPLVHEDRVVGVLELAAFEPPSARANAFIEEFLPILAVGLDNQIREREYLRGLPAHEL